MALLDLRSLLDEVSSTPEEPTEVGVPGTGDTASGITVAGETDMLNDALGQIGASRISNINDGTPNANWCKTFYPSLRRAMLRSHFWNFAERRVELPQDAQAPAFEYAFSYTLPSDWLRMKEYNGSDMTTVAWDPAFMITLARFYKIEGRKLLTNDGRVLIVYVRDITNPAEWDALFYQAITTWLASKLALAIPKDVGRSSELLQQALSLLVPLATAVDGQEGSLRAHSVPDLLWGR